MLRGVQPAIKGTGRVYVAPALERRALTLALGAGAFAGAISLPRIPTFIGGNPSGLVQSPALGAVVAVNAWLPIGGLMLGVLFPKVRTLLLGTVLAFGMFLLVRAFAFQPQFWKWSARVLPPLVVAEVAVSFAGALVLGLCGIGAARVVGRRVGVQAQPWECPGCGYDLRGTLAAVNTAEEPGGKAERPMVKCPECGLESRPIAPRPE